MLLFHRQVLVEQGSNPVKWWELGQDEPDRPLFADLESVRRPSALPAEDGRRCGGIGWSSPSSEHVLDNRSGHHLDLGLGSMVEHEQQLMAALDPRFTVSVFPTD